jgi:hypothetical protein
MEAQTQIIVAKEGWVFVGDASREGDFVVLRRAHNVALWGTSKGLGELVDGPTSSTVLDRCGVGAMVRMHAYNVMHDIAVNASAWSARLDAVPDHHRGRDVAGIETENIELVVCERRWMYLGRVTREGDYLAIREAMNIRRWPIATWSMVALWDLCHGKKASGVVADPVGFVRVGVLGTVAEIGCVPTASSLLPARLAKRGAP